MTDITICKDVTLNQLVWKGGLTEKELDTVIDLIKNIIRAKKPGAWVDPFTRFEQKRKLEAT